MSDGRIQWPMTLAGRNKAFIHCGDLARAVQQEAAIAVCHWWGVTAQTVTKWRKALDVEQYTEATRRLHREWMPHRLTPAERRKAVARMSSPEANAKKSAWRTGRPAPPSVLPILAGARLLLRTPAALKKLSDTHKRLGTRPPAAGKPWSAAEDTLLGRRPDAEVATRCRRTLWAVQHRRRVLGIPRF